MKWITILKYASEDIMTEFKSQALHTTRIKYWKASGSGNPPSLIPALWKVGILLHKQATHTNISSVVEF